MAQTIVQTHSDVMAHLIDWSGTASTDPGSVRRMKRAIEAAYREVAGQRQWAYYHQRGRLDTVAYYNTGTIAYDNTTRTVTLTSGTWPTWAAFGIIQIAGVEYKVVTRSSSSAIILSVNQNPGADVSSGTSYLLYRSDYPLPVDFQSMGVIRNATTDRELWYEEPNEVVGHRYYNLQPTQPYRYSLLRDPNYVGTIGINIFPPPDQVYHFDYMYRRRPRQFSVNSYTTGTVTTSGTTLTGTGTTFTSNMVGCVWRSGTSSTVPTGTTGTDPFGNQRIITAYTSATSLTLDQALDSEVSGVKFEISDPIEIEAGAMYTAFLRRAEYELGVQQRRDDSGQLMQLAQAALLLAFEQDRRNHDRVPHMPRYPQRIPTYWPISNATG